MTRRTGSWLLVAALAVAGAACGGDDDDATAATAAADTTAAAPAATAGGADTATTVGGGDETATSTAPSTSAAGSTAGPATGEPIKLVYHTNLGTGVNEDSTAGIAFAVKGFNERGGVNGRPLEVEYCEAPPDPNATAACARDAVDDADVVAIVGASSSYGSSSNPIIEQGGLACIGCVPYTPSDYSSPVFYAMRAGGMAVGGQVAAAVDELGAERVAIPTEGVPAVAGLPDTLNAGVLAPRGLEHVAAPMIAPGTPDVSAFVAEMVSADADAITPALDGDLTSRVLQNARQQGLDVPFVVPGGVYDAAQIEKDLAGANENVFVAAQFNYTGPVWELFLADHDKFDPDWNVNGETLGGWTAVKLFVDVASTLDEVTRENVTAAMAELSDYDTGGLTPPLDFTKDSTVMGGAMPQLINPTVVLFEYKDGELVPYGDGGFVEIFGEE